MGVELATQGFRVDVGPGGSLDIVALNALDLTLGV